MFRLFVPLVLLIPLVLFAAGPEPIPSEPARVVDVRQQIDLTDVLPGDLVFRRGRTWLSRAVLEMDADSGFSHVGLVAFDGPTPMVVHASPGIDGEPGVVAAEPLAEYLAPDHARAAAIYRVPLIEAAIDASRRARGWARDAVPFDGGFDASTADALYCTELVWRAYAEAGIDLLDGRLDTLDLPLGPDRYVLPSSLASSRHTIEIQSTRAAPKQ